MADSPEWRPAGARSAGHGQVSMLIRIGFYAEMRDGTKPESDVPIVEAVRTRAAPAEADLFAHIRPATGLRVAVRAICGEQQPRPLPAAVGGLGGKFSNILLVHS